MFKEKDAEDLREELGLTDKRANELVDIVQSIMDQAASGGEYGRTSHVLLDIAGRKDLNDVEKTACTFIFSCKVLNKDGIGIIGSERNRSERNRSERNTKRSRPPEIHIPSMPMPFPGMGNLKTKEFIDIEGKASGMIIAPEGVELEDAIGPIMAILMSMLRQMPKSEAQEFCRHASLSFARIAMTGDVKL
jgi:hypothetical protein